MRSSSVLDFFVSPLVLSLFFLQGGDSTSGGSENFHIQSSTIQIHNRDCFHMGKFAEKDDYGLFFFAPLCSFAWICPNSSLPTVCFVCACRHVHLRSAPRHHPECELRQTHLHHGRTQPAPPGLPLSSVQACLVRPLLGQRVGLPPPCRRSGNKRVHRHLPDLLAQAAPENRPERSPSQRSGDVCDCSLHGRSQRRTSNLHGHELPQAPQLDHG